MRFLLLLWCSMWVFVSVQAQDKDEVLDRKVTLRLEMATIPEALEALEQAAGVNFIYSNDYVPFKKAYYRFEGTALRQVLPIVLEGTRLGYVAYGQDIIIKRREDLPDKLLRYTVSGKIRDKLTGEELIGVNVLLSGTTQGTASNTSGFYSISLEEGAHELIFSILGYKSEALGINVSGHIHLDISLEEIQTQLQEVQIKDRPGEQASVKDRQMSVLHVTPRTIRQLPTLFGEYDPLRAIQLLPGVQKGPEGSTGFYVRGGGSDQNLILMDDAPVYNASHLLGFFSVFNTDVVRDVSLYKGGIPARYGGRLSSVLDVRLRDGNTKRFTVTGGLGTIASRLAIESPFAKGKGTFLLAGRRTYLDFLLRNVPLRAVSQNLANFYDINIKASYRFNERHKLQLSGYFGQDNVGFEDYFLTTWGNTANSLRWNVVLSPKWFLNTTLYATVFRTVTSDATFSNFAFQSSYSIQDYGIKQDFSHYRSTKTQWDFGFEVIHRQYFFGEIEPTTANSVVRRRRINPAYALEQAVYGSLDHELFRNLTVNAGLRISRFSNLGPGYSYRYDGDPLTPGTRQVTDTLWHGSWHEYNVYGGLEPRLSLRYLLSQRSSVKASYQRTRQYMHLLAATNNPSPVAMWAPVNPYIPPQIGDLWALGYFYEFGREDMYAASIEAYYKALQNQIDFKPLANLLYNDQVEQELLRGKGTSYGLELLLRKQKGRLTGWLSYTLSRSNRQIRGLNADQPYPASFDRRHDLALVFSYQISRRVFLSASWVYASGVAYTFPVGKYEHEGLIVPLYSARNGARLPDTHRLDLSISLYRRSSEKHRNESSFNFSLYNAYGRRNTYAYIFRQSRQDPDRTEAVKLYLFSIVPSFTYNFKF